MSDICISLKAIHPFEDPSVLCSRLGLSIARSWMAGEPRRTPRGMPLEGVYSESYCVGDLPLSESDDLAQLLSEVVTLLNPFATEMEAFALRGGSISLFITLEKDHFRGCMLQPQLLSSLGRLCIALELNGYDYRVTAQ